MKKIQNKKSILRNLLIIAMVLTFIGCGKTSSNSETSTEPKEQEITVQEPATQEEVQKETVQEETVQEEVTVQEPVTQEKTKIDLETFAAQEDNQDICIVVYNEKTGEQIILKEENNIRQIQDGDRFFIPIRDFYSVINYNSDISDVSEIYVKGKTAESKYIEFQTEPGRGYNVVIHPADGDSVGFGLINY